MPQAASVPWRFGWHNVYMADRDILERMDRHMERGNELMERIDVHMERADQHMERGNELMERIDGTMERIDATIERTRETIAVEQRATRDFFASVMTRFDRNMLRIDRRMASHEAVTSELRAESRAQTQALLRVIDRMDRFDPGGAAA